MPANYAELSCMSLIIVRSLRVPIFTKTDEEESGVWVSSPDPLICEPLVGFWTEHSERNGLTSWAAALKFPKEYRDRLGGWNPTGSD
eukprot:12115954-Heterocapsa_arctica.AAC.1